MFVRCLGSLTCVLLLVPVSRAEPLTIRETIKPGDCFQVQLEMKLTGQLQLNRQGTPVNLNLSAAGSLGLTEKVLTVTGEGLSEKVARIYDNARATITVDKDRSERTLRPERRLIVAQRHKDIHLVYAPSGALTRDELDLAGHHMDTLFLVGLLPEKPVEVGGTWKIPNHVVQALCAYEGLTEKDLTAKLEEAKDQVALVSIQGSATGIDNGALVKSKVEATAKFDLTGKRLIHLEWKQTDEREQGPVNPRSTTQTWWTLTRKPIEVPPSLSEVALVVVPGNFTPPETMTVLEHRDAQGRFKAVYARDWHLVGNTPSHLVLRCLDRGDFLGQVTVAPWTTPNGKRMTPEEFKLAMSKLPGWEVEQELQAGEVPGMDRYVYRLSLAGKMDGIPVVQNFYLVGGKTEQQQVIVTFTMSPKQVEKFGVRDLSFVGSLEVPASEAK